MEQWEWPVISKHRKHKECHRRQDNTPGFSLIRFSYYDSDRARGTCDFVWFVLFLNKCLGFQFQGL